MRIVARIPALSGSLLAALVIALTGAACGTNLTNS